ncbi:hypothetical protein E2C01_066399 [Portunus trituberculatus]|uniref:Uncharacterized protein n=1 Tax=Portunus trituberculatus TaxID=210409 RepID=A0A5B7HQ60_PORTR|nr:hypothetical protein [Portunus trituberculatus]
MHTWRLEWDTTLTDKGNGLSLCRATAVHCLSGEKDIDGKKDSWRDIADRGSTRASAFQYMSGCVSGSLGLSGARPRRWGPVHDGKTRAGGPESSRVVASGCGRHREWLEVARTGCYNSGIITTGFYLAEWLGIVNSP